MHDRWSRRIAAAFAASVMLTMLGAFPLRAQAGLGQLDDATTPPRGFLRLRAITAWTRLDGRFTADGAESLGASFTSSAFGADRLAPLGAIQSLVQSAAGQPFVLSLGQSRLDATLREEVLPLALEYGVSRRLSVGVTMPIVRKRAAMLLRFDTIGATANVGPNLQRTSASAAQTNATVQSQFTTAIAALQNRLTSCAANPAGAGCASIAGREAQAQQLIQSSQGFATAVESLYGSASSAGMAFVPIAGSTAQQEIAVRISDFNAEYRDLLASGSDLLTAVPRAAGGMAGVSEFQNYLTDDLGLDSVATEERVGIGDMELGVKWLALDRPRAPGGRTSLQVALAGGVRLPTGSRDSPSDVVDMRLGNGSVVVDSRAILDMRTGRFGLLATGHFASSVHDVDTVGLATRNSRWTEIHLAPRWHLSEPFSIHAAYSLRSTDKLGGDELVGGGVSFTSLAKFQGIGSPPVEMRFTHLESIRGDPGRPKFFREQLELRIYYRLLGR
jgi:hypothetical protein